MAPAGGHALNGRIDGNFPILLGWSIESSELLYKLGKSGTGESLIKLMLVNREGERKQILTSHVIAGTGFRISLARLRFLDDSLRNAIRTSKTGAPRLSRNFQSSVPGLHFVGPIAVPPALARCFVSPPEPSSPPPRSPPISRASSPRTQPASPAHKTNPQLQPTWPDKTSAPHRSFPPIVILSEAKNLSSCRCDCTCICRCS